MPAEVDLPVVHNTAAKRFEISLDGKVAFSKYLLAGEMIVIEHTEVPVELEGKGLASLIVRTALDYARAQKLKVMPLCAFTAGFIHRHRSIRTSCWKGIATEGSYGGGEVMPPGKFPN